MWVEIVAQVKADKDVENWLLPLYSIGSSIRHTLISSQVLSSAQMSRFSFLFLFGLFLPALTTASPAKLKHDQEHVALGD